MTDREYVESRWADAHWDAAAVLDVRVGLNGTLLVGGPTQAWQTAAEFTRTREKQIVEVKEEIAVIAEYKASRDQILTYR